MKCLPAYLLILPVFLLSCHFMNDRIRGNGTVTTETRQATNFSKVDVGGNIHVYLKQDSAYSVRIETDENLLPYIVVRNDGDKLIIEPKDHHNLDGSNGIKVYVSAPVFKYLEASGASSFDSENKLTSSEMLSIELSGASHANIELQSPKVSSEISGASSVTLKGQTKDLVVDGEGASHAKCFDLMTENADIDVSGASSANVFASMTLNAEASGASHIKYRGNATVKSSASGASGVEKDQ